MDHCFLNSVLRNEQGNTMGITSLYLAVGRRLGLPLFMVKVEDKRIYPRYFDGERTIDIDVPDEAGSDKPVYRIIETRAEYPVVAWRAGIAELLVLRGSAHWHAQKLESANKDWLLALKIDPENIYALRYMVLIAHENGDYVQAVSYLNKILKTNPESAIDYYSRGIEWNNHGDVDKALADFTRSIELDPGNWKVIRARADIWYQRSNFDPIIEDCNSVIKNDASNADAFLFRGLARHGKQDYEKAIADYTKVIELRPDWAHAYMNRGVTWNAKEEYDKALEDYTKAIELSPDWALVYYNRGVTWNEKYEYRKAIDDFNRALELEPGNLNFLLERAYTWFLACEVDKAVTDYTDALEYGQYTAWILNKRGHAWIRGGYYDKAIEDYSQAIETEPESIEYILNRASARYTAGYYDKAIADYTRILQLAPDDAATFYNLGLCWFQMNDFESAIDNLSRSIELDPRMINPYLMRGRAWHEMGDYDRAIADYTKVIEIEDSTEWSDWSNRYSPYNSMEAEFRRGFAWAKKGNVQKANKDISWALSISPDNELAEEAQRVREELLFGNDNETKLDKAVASLRGNQLSKMTDSEKKDKSNEIAGAWKVITSEGEKGLERVKKELAAIKEQGESDDFFQLAAAGLLWELAGLEEAEELTRIYETVDLTLQFNYVFWPVYQAAMQQNPKALPMMKAILREKRDDVLMEMHAMGLKWPYTIELIWGAYGPEGLHSLHDLLESSNDPVVLQSVIHLLTNAQYVEALPRLRKLAKHKNDDVRRSAIKSIGKFGHPEDYKFLINGLESEDPSEAFYYVYALYEYKDLRAAGPIADLLSTKDDKLWQEVFAALNHLICPVALEALRDHGSKTSNAKQKQYCDKIVESFHAMTGLDWNTYSAKSKEEQTKLFLDRHDEGWAKKYALQDGDRKLNREEFLNTAEKWKKNRSFWVADLDWIKDRNNFTAATPEDITLLLKGKIEDRHIFTAATPEDIPLLLEVKAAFCTRFSDECLYDIKRLNRLIYWVGRTRYRKIPGICLGVEPK
jgi:tetratricopeptide (TPR) repeat protein